MKIKLTMRLIATEGNNMEVIIDADFINAITSINNDPGLFVTIINDLDVKPYVHTYVANQELFSNNIFKDLLSDGSITEIKYEDFLPDELKDVYASEFLKLYKAVNGPENLPINVFHDRRAQRNMGEIHSILLAKEKNITVFLSNDRGAKALAVSYINNSLYKLDVKNIPTIIEEIAKNPNKKTKWRSAKQLLKNLRISSQEIGRIKLLWE